MADIRSQTRAFDGDWIQVDVLDVAQEEGEPERHEVVRHRPGVAIVLLQEQSDVVAYGNQVILVNHYRVPIERKLLELVAGIMDEGESPLQAAQREVREELGMAADRWDELGTLFSSAGFTDEKITLFLARGARPIDTERDEGEALSPHMVPFSLALEQVRKGEIMDMKTALGLMWAAAFMQAEQAQ